MLGILKGIVEECKAKDKKDALKSSTDEDLRRDIKDKGKKRNQLLCCALRCLGAVWCRMPANVSTANTGTKTDTDTATQSETKAETKSNVEYLISEYLFQMAHGDWMIQISVLKGVLQWFEDFEFELFERFEDSGGDSGKALLSRLVTDGLLVGLENSKYAAVRHQSICALSGLLKNRAVLQSGLLDKELIERIRKRTDHLIDTDKKPLVVSAAIALKKLILHALY